MKFTERPSLKPFNTFGLGCRAAALIEIESEEDLLELPGFSPGHDFVLGGGSNVVLLSDVPGTTRDAVDTAIRRFGEAGLLTFDRDPVDNAPTVEVAHEALLAEWPRLRTWIDESRLDLQIVDGL